MIRSRPFVLPVRRHVHGPVVARALVDADVFAEVHRYRWRLSRGGYVFRSSTRTVYLHRLVMGLAFGDELEVDHRNHDRLDCRRENLRVGPRRLNAQNVRVRSGVTSRFRGVSWYAPRGYWQAYVTVDGRQRKLGYRRDEVEAALLAQAARDELMPFALPDPELVAALEERMVA